MYFPCFLNNCVNESDSIRASTGIWCVPDIMCMYFQSINVQCSRSCLEVSGHEVLQFVHT